MGISIGSVVGQVLGSADKVMDLASGPLDPLAKLLPGPLGDMAKVAAGVVTGNPLLVANGAVGIGQSALQACGPQTEHVPSKQAGKCPPGYAPEVAPRKKSEREEQLQHLQELERHFEGQAFGKFKEKDLIRILNDSQAPRSLQEAAGYLLAHPGFKALVDTAGEGGKADGTISLKDLRAMIAKTRAQLMYGPPEPCAGPSAPSAPASTQTAGPAGGAGSAGASSSSAGATSAASSGTTTAAGVPIRYEPGSHLDPNYPAYVEALHVLDQNWLTFDSAFGIRDQYLRREDLRAIAENPNASATLKDAARFLLQHPEYFNRLEMAAGIGGKDGIVGWGDVKAALATARKDLATYGVPPPPGGSQAASSHAAGSTGAGAAKGAHGYDGILNDTSLGIDERIQLLLERAYSGLGTELEALAREFAAAQKGEKGARSAEDLQLEIQRLSEKRNRMFGLMTTLSQKSHELAKQALQNMGRA